MRLVALVMVGACGGASATASITTTTNAAISGIVTTTHFAEGDLGASPDEVQDHLHQVAVYSADFDRLYVEVTSDGEHANVLRESATRGLSTVPYVVAVLLAIADGSGRAAGANAADACLSATGAAIVQQKLPPFLSRQLDAK